ncbi:HD domain-containing protein [bacterium]|nr:HD domain-containing protein [bacterium]MBU1599186.1 HD domain-containing protein [bacterium]MBU2461682.1 HD domain-containing protein [bacterium]
MRVIIIEKQESCEKLSELLIKRGCEVDMATDGVSGLKKIYSTHASLIILNAFLPEIDGHQLCYLIRGDEKYSSIPIIIIEPADKSCYIDESLHIEGRIKEPYSQDEILKLIGTIVKKREKEAGGEVASREIDKLKEKITTQEKKIQEMVDSIERFKMSKDAVAKVNSLLNKQIQELTFSYKIQKELSGAFTDWDETTNILFRMMKELIKFEVGFAGFYEKQKGGRLYIKTEALLGEGYCDDLWLKIQEKAAYIEREKTGISGINLYSDTQKDLHCFLTFVSPLYGKNAEEKVFLCGISRNESMPYIEEEIERFEGIAKHAIMGFAHSLLFEELERAYLNIVSSIIEAMEGKQKYQAGHSGRVAVYAKAICETLGLEKRQTDLIHDAALLHDIGKAIIPETVLNKTGKLTEDEFALIKSHPKAAKDLLSSFAAFQEMLPIIYYHHEKFGGGGYGKLSGTAIPLGARILAVCDAFDAMITDRPYRKAISTEMALNELKEGVGTQFDPTVVKAFLKSWLEQRVGVGATK